MRQKSVPVSFHDLKPDTGHFLEEVIAGLSRPQKTLNPKYFYDRRGCELFEAICELPEYYPTRTETAIMRERSREIAEYLGPDCVLIEYGSGTSRKTRLLIEPLKPAAYVAIDIAGDQLEASVTQLAGAFPELKIIAVCADYSRTLSLPEIDGMRPRRRVVYFPGSTIGNFTPRDALVFLRNARLLVGHGGGMLVGVDLKKDRALLHAAYNDARGVTAEFNLNLLARLNRELGANFDLSAFRHLAFYNAEAGRIEMHLVSRKTQCVTVGGREFKFRPDETIHTENSYKYSIDEFRELARSAGFEPKNCATDPGQLFAVHYLAVSN